MTAARKLNPGATRAIAQSVIAREAALSAAEAAIARAQALGIRINVAVVDSGGHMSVFQRMPGAFLHSIGIAQDKAYTSVSFGLPTAQLFDLIKDDPALREGLVQRERLVAFGGGLPIKINGELIGAIGVSGGTAEQDAECAAASLAAIGADAVAEGGGR